MEESDFEEGQLSNISIASKDEYGGDGSEGGNENGNGNEERILKTILPVAPIDEDFNPDNEPRTGEEYLRIVRYQSNLLPFSQTMENPPDTTQNVFPSHANFLLNLLKCTPQIRFPKPEQIQGFLQVFLEARKLEFDDEVEEGYPEFGSEERWKSFLYPNTELEPSSKRSRTNSLKDYLLEYSPSQRQLIQLVKFHTKWIRDSKGIDIEKFQWLIRIFQCLDTRLTARQISFLRELALLLIELRSRDTVLEEELFYLNGIIIIVSKIFGQLDLLLEGAQEN